MGQAQVAATVALSQKPNFAFPCRIFRPAATLTRWTQLTLVSTTSRLFQDRESCFSGPPFHTNDLMRNLDQGVPNNRRGLRSLRVCALLARS